MRTLYVTVSRAISAGVDERRAEIRRKHRRMARQGIMHGLRAELGLRHLDRFWDVYAHSVHALGSPVFPRRLFHAIAQEFGKECGLLTVWKEDTEGAGVLSLFSEGWGLQY